MAKRGPKPKPNAGPSVVFSSRMAPELKAKLEEAAAARGRTLSDEIQMRLRRTFIDDEKIEEIFGDRETYMLLRVVALAIQLVPGEISFHDQSWLQNPAKFDMAAKTINRLLEAVRPEGDPNQMGLRADSTIEEIEAFKNHFQQRVASEIWLNVKYADPSLPLNQGSVWDHRMGIIKAEIGAVAERSHASLADMAARDEAFNNFVKQAAANRRTKK
ncbi:MAG: hypothetical protein E5V58_10905 [Mesorhizobium sp.]|nr:MAG: hypothetical protein E5V58_10905 [Mesorhizobium sp.]